jgi:hypothetical protein
VSIAAACLPMTVFLSFVSRDSVPRLHDSGVPDRRMARR